VELPGREKLAINGFFHPKLSHEMFWNQQKCRFTRQTEVLLSFPY